MSGSRSIAAVTAALRYRLQQAIAAELPGVKVTTRPPDKARETHGCQQVNLFLYLTRPNAAWRNFPRPQTGPADTFPLFALDLYYLISCYGHDDEDADLGSHRLLGTALSALHQNPVLTREELDAVDGIQAAHPERKGLGITLLTLSLEEMTKLWSAFQTEYRLSSAFEISGALINETEIK